MIYKKQALKPVFYIMQCKSCQSIVDPKWKYAIDSNICPSCGGEIMSVELKTCLAGLNAIHSQYYETYEIEIKDWITSNLKLHVLTTEELESYAKKAKPKRDSSDSSDQPSESFNKFMDKQHAGVMTKQSKLKEIADKFKKGESEESLLLAPTGDAIPKGFTDAKSLNKLFNNQYGGEDNGEDNGEDYEDEDEDYGNEIHPLAYALAKRASTKTLPDDAAVKIFHAREKQKRKQAKNALNGSGGGFRRA
jgi:predicted RNA-binding Zn-ribbon protein involved in translation (DUF1610 family)